METKIIIQARMGSTRLPGKTMMLLDNKPVIAWVVSRCMQTNLPVIVATPKTEDNKPIWDWCLQEGVPFFRGEDTNVLKRYLDCAREYEADPIVRITADCPFIEPKIIKKVVESFNGNYINHDQRQGQGVEVFSLAQLQETYDTFGEDEHVMSNVAPEWIDFDWVEMGVPLTLDTKEDYLRLCELAPTYHA